MAFLGSAEKAAQDSERADTRPRSEPNLSAFDRVSTPVALVDDDPLYAEALAGDLRDRGFTVQAFSDGESLLAALQEGLRTELVLLDWTLPGMSGIAVLQALRGGGWEVPVVLLTGQSPVERELEALRHGAIDFVDKVRGIDVLTSRLRLLVGARPRPPEAVRCGDLVLHPGTARAEWRGHDIGLTLSEYKVVSTLVAAAGTPVSFRSIHDRVHYEGFISGSGERGYEVNVRGMMKRIRRKFSSVDQSFDAIGTVIASGYCWGPMPRHDRTSSDAEHPLDHRH
jgi:two-component system response regulator ChvI